MSGYFTKTVNFDPGPATKYLSSPGRSDVFISKYDFNGNLIWAKGTGGSTSKYNSIAVDAAKSIYITGEFRDSVDFDPGPGTAILTSLGNNDSFVSKLDSGGNFQWVRSFGGVKVESGKSIAVGKDGRIYATGVFAGTVDFDPGPGKFSLTSTEYFDIYILNLTSDGAFVWVKQIGGPYNEDVKKIVLGQDGSIYTTGVYTWETDFDPGPDTVVRPTGFSQDIFILKLDPKGNYRWATGIGGPDDDEGISIAVDSNDNIAATGWFEKVVDFDPGSGILPRTSAGETDIFITRYRACSMTTGNLTASACKRYRSPSGKHVWSASGNYSDTIPNSTGCDSIITVNLHIELENNVIWQSGNTLHAQLANARYQWLDCTHGYASITGDTNQSFTPITNGNYTVEVIRNGCRDTSDCYSFVPSGVRNNMIGKGMVIRPNPTEGSVRLDFGRQVHSADVVITDAIGREVSTQHFSSVSELNLNIVGASGTYFFHVIADGKSSVVAVVKQ